MNSQQIDNYGILASIGWNSNRWSDQPTEADLTSSKYDFVHENRHMHEALNFGQEVYPSESDGYYIGYTPMFNRPPDKQKSKNVEFLFLLSSDYKNGNKKCVVGLYAYPQFGSWYTRKANHKLYKKYDSGNIKSLSKNIIFFEHPIIIDNTSVQGYKLLPESKKISQQGFNYLNSQNVQNLLALALSKNPFNLKLQNLLSELPMNISLANELLEEDVKYSEGREAYYWHRRKERNPKVAKEAKLRFRQTHGKLFCQACGFDFAERYGKLGAGFIEAHHMIPVSQMKECDETRLEDIALLCSNCHRMVHRYEPWIADVNDLDKIFDS